MPNLYPTLQPTPGLPETAAPAQVQFGSSWRFDFAAGEFVLSPTGKVATSQDVDAWLEWCQKALMTARYRYMAYSRKYGQEFDDLITRGLGRAANESEIKRIATECLMVDPRTASVGGFTFTWDGDKCYFTCNVTNTLGQTETVSGSVVTS